MISQIFEKQLASIPTNRVSDSEGTHQHILRTLSTLWDSLQADSMVI